MLLIVATRDMDTATGTHVHPGQHLTTKNYLAPHINITDTEKSCCPDPSRVLQGGGLPSFLWLPLAYLLPDFFWLIWPHVFCFLFFAFAFCHAKLKPLICWLFYSFPDILVWFPARGEANAWTQLPPWTSNPVILTLFKSLWCLQYDSICYSLLSELLETLAKVLVIRVMYWIGLLLNKESLKYFNAKKMEVYFSPVWQVWHQGGITPCYYPDTQASSFLLVCHSPSVVFKQKEKELEVTISVLPFERCGERGPPV